MPATVLFITSEPAHRLLYERGLKKHFSVKYSAKAGAKPEDLAAVIYDIPSLHESIDVRWLDTLRVPTVILTPETAGPLYRAVDRPDRRILTYPVKLDQILRALAELGIRGARRPAKEEEGE